MRKRYMTGVFATAAAAAAAFTASSVIDFAKNTVHKSSMQARAIYGMSPTKATTTESPTIDGVIPGSNGIHYTYRTKQP